MVVFVVLFCTFMPLYVHTRLYIIQCIVWRKHDFGFHIKKLTCKNVRRDEFGNCYRQFVKKDKIARMDYLNNSSESLERTTLGLESFAAWEIWYFKMVYPKTFCWRCCSHDAAIDYDTVKWWMKQKSKLEISRELTSKLKWYLRNRKNDIFRFC